MENTVQWEDVVWLSGRCRTWGRTIRREAQLRSSVIGGIRLSEVRSRWFLD